MAAAAAAVVVMLLLFASVAVQAVSERPAVRITLGRRFLTLHHPRRPRAAVDDTAVRQARTPTRDDDNHGQPAAAGIARRCAHVACVRRLPVLVWLAHQPAMNGALSSGGGGGGKAAGCRPPPLCCWAVHAFAAQGLDMVFISCFDNTPQENTQTRARAHARTHIHTRTRARARAHTHTHARTHACARTHAHRKNAHTFYANEARHGLVCAVPVGPRNPFRHYAWCRAPRTCFGARHARLS